MMRAKVGRRESAGRQCLACHASRHCASTIVIMLILKMGKIFDVGYERVMLRHNPQFTTPPMSLTHTFTVKA